MLPCGTSPRFFLTGLFYGKTQKRRMQHAGTKRNRTKKHGSVLAWGDAQTGAQSSRFYQAESIGGRGDRERRPLARRGIPSKGGHAACGDPCPAGGRGNGQRRYPLRQFGAVLSLRQNPALYGSDYRRGYPKGGLLYAGPQPARFWPWFFPPAGSRYRSELGLFGTGSQTFKRSVYRQHAGRAAFCGFEGGADLRWQNGRRRWQLPVDNGAGGAGKRPFFKA